jgi:Rho GTPase-activating protein 1
LDSLPYSPLSISAEFDLVEDDLSVGSVPTEMGVMVGGGLQSPMSDGTIEEDFEAALAKENNSGHGIDSGRTGMADRSELPTHPVTLSGQSIDDEDFSDIARHGIVEVVGDDAAGRKVIVISACRLPSNKGFDHQRFLR